MMRLVMLGLLLAAATTQLANKNDLPPGTIKIDGEAHPERIPDHWIWRSSFLLLTEVSRTGSQKDLAEILPLSDEDAKVLYKEAGQQAKRDADCQARIDARKKALEDERKKSAEIGRAVRTLMVECNALVLDAADRVMDALSEEGRLICQTWIERRRRKTTLLVPETELREYALPR